MKTVWTLALSVALAAASSSAFAFQEQKGGGAPVPGAAPQAAPVSGEAPPQADFSAGGGEKASEGTEIRLPGVGKIGVLPKMDFGLELLYGATESAKEPETPSAQDGSGEDVTIRGSLKHKF